MQSEEFDNHSAWTYISRSVALIKRLTSSATPPESLQLQRIRQLATIAQAYKPIGLQSADRFNELMLDPLNQTWAQVEQYLQMREGDPYTPQYTQTALTYAEQTLLQVGIFPQPYAEPAQQALISNLYEDLRRAQAEQIAELASARERFSRDLNNLRAEISKEVTNAQTSLQEVVVTSEAIAQEALDQSTRVDATIERGNESIAGFMSVSTSRFDEWLQESISKLQSEFEPFQNGIEGRLQSADKTLNQLKTKEREYANMSSAVAAGTLSEAFEREATRSRIIGLALYVVGFFLLIAAALPLVWLVLSGTEPSAAKDNWAPLVARASIGIVLASAATVAIRLGSRFVTVSDNSKRTELELRAFGPFLANVNKTELDQARLAFVDRAFLGKSSTETVKEDDVIAVSTFSQILSAVAKVANR